jgi:uncharacterized protein
MNRQSRNELDVALPAAHPVQWQARIALAIIAVYRAVISPVLTSVVGPACRFEPTCSAFAAQAIALHGISRGGWMALKRLMRCQPLSGWGFDPVPKTLLTMESTRPDTMSCHIERKTLG